MPRKDYAQPEPDPTPPPAPEYTPYTGPRRKSLPLPAAIILEVCKHAYALDVLHLARTCKALRCVLRARSSNSAWEQAFSNAGLPQCPDDVAGPHYAALFYESVCDECGTSRCKKGRRDVHWNLRRRLCVKCTRKTLVPVPRSCHGLPDGQLRDLVPTSGMAGFSSMGKAYNPTLDKIKSDILAAVGAPELASLVDELKRRREAINSHSRECEQWNEDEARKLIEKEDIAIRQASVCSRLQDEGWGEQLDIYRPYVLSHELVNQAKQLFDDDWELYRERIKEDAVSKWTAKHESKLLKQKKTTTKTFGDGGVWPDGNDLRRMPGLQPMLDGGDVVPEAVCNGALTDGPALIAAPIGNHTQSPVAADPALSAIPPTAARADHTPGDQAHSTVVAGNSSKCVVDVKDDGENDEDDHSENNEDAQGENEEDDNVSCYSWSDGTHRENARSDREDSILPPGHDLDYYKTRSSDTDSDAEEEIPGVGLSKTQEEAAISATIDRLFPSALIAWRRSISLRLFDTIPSKNLRSVAGEEEISTDDAKIAFLSRAATVFECHGSTDLYDTWLRCGGDHHGLPSSWDSEGQLVFYPEALKHREVCAIGNLDRMEYLEDRMDCPTFESESELRVAWSPDSLKLAKSGSAFMRKLVQAAGLDHRVATRRELDEVDARFVCKLCLDLPELDGKSALKVHNWLSSLHDAFQKREVFGDGGHCGGKHRARFVRVTNPSAEARVRELAPRGDNFQPLSVALSELGLKREALLG